MSRKIKKAAVLGSGVMGSAIACHFANIGLEVLLLDIIPKEPNEAETKKGLTTNDKPVRNRIVNDSFQRSINSKPAPLYNKSFADRVALGNFDDDMSKIKDCDWVIEVVVENLAVKKTVFEQVEKHRTSGTLITSNTSGIPINLMLDGRSDDFKKHFCGTHFFNPPRYLPLLEIIPTKETDPNVVDFFMHYGDRFLGKTTVLCKDTPAFIANRVGVFNLTDTLHTAFEMNLTVEEVDKLTGPVIGNPKSATFRTMDVVGLDTMLKVADNLHGAVPNDNRRDRLSIPDVVRKTVEGGRLGEKSGEGFYKKTVVDGKKDILALDFNTLQYRRQEKAKFPTLEQTKPIDNLKERIPVLLNGQDKAGEFYRKTCAGLFEYVADRIPEIADELYRIDDAVRAGFNRELGPFEMWDACGVQKGIEILEAEGKTPATWVKDMLSAGHSSFYKTENGTKQFYDIPSKSYKPVPGSEAFIILDNLRESHKVWGNAGATIFDIGDGILNLEFHTKMNTIGSEVIEGINHAIAVAEKDFRGLVIGNQGPNFSAGANIGIIFMHAVEQEYDEINHMIRVFQNTMMRVRYSSIPVVVAPHGLTLGGGCEISLHADRLQLAAETYIGLVEFGVGVIPGGGGTKEMTLRVSDSFEEGDVELNSLQNAFMNIATAKVATSAYEGIDMNYVRHSDGITLNKNRQIADAKSAVVELADAGYTQPKQRTDIKVLGKTAIALFKTGIHGMLTGHYISEHDKKVAEKLAYVMSGGDLSSPAHVSEQYLLDLEREAFLSLTGEKKTLERIQSILTTGKPLRN